MRRRRPASVSSIAKVGTGGKSRLVLFVKENAVWWAGYAIKSAKWPTPARLLHQAMLSFSVDVEALVS